MFYKEKNNQIQLQFVYSKWTLFNFALKFAIKNDNEKKGQRERDRDVLFYLDFNQTNE